MEIIEKFSINTIRGLSIDMVEAANSGHPGMPLGAAPMAYTVFTRFLKHNPANAKWHDRDRFLLSCGHGCALLYSLLHLCGYGLTLDDLKNFRKWGSRTPGHPEYGRTPGVEATTGPLGQGFGMGIGMALAEKELAANFNRPGFNIIDHYTYAIVSDGDLMEGVSSEAASLAGTNRLGKLIYLYDNNHISIDGNTSITFTENVRQRFDGYGWHTHIVHDGNNTDEISAAITEAKAQKERPSLILVRTHIGYASPKQDTAEAHGEPLGPEAAKATKKNLGLNPEAQFEVSKEVAEHFAVLQKKWSTDEAQWQEMLMSYRKKYPVEAGLLDRFLNGDIPEELKGILSKMPRETKDTATRELSGRAMNTIEKYAPQFIGGSGDLSGSTKTILHGYGCVGFSPECERNIHYGVREHAMAAATNGIALHGGFIPYCSTFLIFSDYMRPAMRIAALMQAHSIFVFSHDSIGLGQDGPTHQPVEHLASLRAMPGFTVYRPADAGETAASWYSAITKKKPCAIVLTRQKTMAIDPSRYNTFNGALMGGYVLEKGADKPDIILIATGSEVGLALEAAEILLAKGVKARVVSIPCVEIFKAQQQEYISSVLPQAITKRVVIEAGSPACWHEYAGKEGVIIGIDRFGASAPGEIVMEKYGFTVDNVVSSAEALLKT